MGSRKSKAVQPSTAKSAYQPVTNYTVDTGFGSANAALDGTNLVVKNILSSPVQQAVNSAQSGLARGANYFAQDPINRLNDAVAGNNAYYNIFNQNTDRIFNNGLADANARFSRSGLNNSTVMGGAVAQLLNDRALTNNQNLLAAIDAQNALEQQALAQNMNIFGGISDISNVPLGMASGNLQTGFGSRDQMNMFNASQMQNAAQFNAQQAAQARAARNAMWGNIIGGIGGAIGTIATAGMGAPMMGAAMGGAGRSMGRFF